MGQRQENVFILRTPSLACGSWNYRLIDASGYLTPSFGVAYFRELFWRALSDSWNTWPALNIMPLIIPAAIFFLSLWAKYHQRRNGEARLQVKDWFQAFGFGVLAFVAIFHFYFFLWTPKTMVEEARQKALQHSRDFRPHEWPSLSEAQISAWAAELAAHRSEIEEIVVFWSVAVDAQNFYRSLQAVGQRAGVKVRASDGEGTTGEIEIEASKTTGPVLLKLFKDSGYQAKFNELEGPTFKKILIFIGDKL